MTRRKQDVKLYLCPSDGSGCGIDYGTGMYRRSNYLGNIGTADSRSMDGRRVGIFNYDRQWDWSVNQQGDHGERHRRRQQWHSTQRLPALLSMAACGRAGECRREQPDEHTPCARLHFQQVHPDIPVGNGSTPPVTIGAIRKRLACLTATCLLPGHAGNDDLFAHGAAKLCGFDCGDYNLTMALLAAQLPHRRSVNMAFAEDRCISSAIPSISPPIRLWERAPATKSSAAGISDRYLPRQSFVSTLIKPNLPPVESIPHARTLIAAWVLIVVLAALSAGCTQNQKGSSGLERPVMVAMPEVQELYFMYQKTEGKPPARLNDLDKLRQAFPRGYQAIQSGEIVVLWGTELSAEKPIAYEKAAPDKGGLVLFGSGAAREMKADELSALKK